MTTMTLGTSQQVWGRVAPFAGAVAAMPGIGDYAYRPTPPNPNDFNGNFCFKLPSMTSGGESLCDMACALMFFFVKNTTTVPTAIARIWGLSQASPPAPANSDAGPFLGTYLGQLELGIGTSHGVPQVADPPKNVFLDNWYMASRISVQQDVSLKPPGIRVVSNSGPETGYAPFVLIDGLGFNRIVVSLRYTDTYGSSGLGCFWRTM